MTSNMYTKFRHLFIMMAAGLVLVTCNADPNGFPRIANPPAFDYADGEELRSRMHQLAFELQQLDLALMTESDDRPNFQREIVDNLQDIERIGGSLQAGDLSTRHPFLRDRMTAFLADVSRARRDASMNPPRLYMAGRVSGGCVNCHQSVQ